MKYNIEPIINKYFSCHQGLLATYASYKKREYIMIFSESWGFRYQREDYPFGVSLSPNYQGRRGILLEKYHGIKIVKEQYTDHKLLMNRIKILLTQSPIMLHCDVFNCPWNILYQRNHVNHYVLIIGLNDSTKQIYILDPYSTKAENTIDISNIAPDSGDISYFVTNEISNIQIENYIFEIDISLRHIDNTGFFQSFKNFHTDFKTRFEEVMITDYLDVYAIPLIINLRRIANQRYCYCIFLNEMLDKKLLNPPILNMMESIAEKYELLRVLLIKQILKKKMNIKESSNIISDIIDREHEAYGKMKLFIA